MAKKTAIPKVAIERPEGEFADFIVSGDAGSKGAVANATQAAKNKLRKANKTENTASITLVGDPRLVKGLTVDIKNFGTFDGKWIIEKAQHKISPSYTTSIDIRRCLNGY